VQNVDFAELAQSLNMSIDELENALQAFNGKLDREASLSQKAIENMRFDNRISMVRSKTRIWFTALLEERKQVDPELSDEAVDALIARAARQSNARQAAQTAQPQIDPDVWEVAKFIHEYRNSNQFFFDYVQKISGSFSIIRKTTKTDEERENQPAFFYEEPLVFSSGSPGARMLAYGDVEMFGLAYGGNGIITIQLFSNHATRGIATRTIMLYTDDRTFKDYIPGIMLRYSDDAIRPVASSIVARFLGEFTSLKELWGALPQEKPRKIRERDPDFAACEAFGIGHHVKAQHRREFRAIVERLNSDGTDPEPGAD